MPRRKRPSADERRRRIVRYPEYQDHSDRSNDWIEKRRSDEANSAPAGGATKMFPTQLHQLLEAVDGTPLSQYVRWLPHGRAFAVVDSPRFESEVLPKYFPKQSALASFYRQLHAYGFLRLSSDKRSYYHELFLRNRPLMAVLIPRHIHGRYSTRRTFDATSEPDLYALPWLPDISRENRVAVVAYATIADDNVTLPPSSCMPRPTQKYLLGERTSILQRATDAKETPVATTILNTMQSHRYDTAFNYDSLPSSMAQRLTPKSHVVFSGPLGPLTASLDGQCKDETNLSTGTRLPYRLSALSEPSHHTMHEANAARWPANVSLDQRMIVGRGDSTFETANINEATDLHTMHFKTVEASSDISSEDDVSEWADFLHDVDLDSSVGSNATKSIKQL